MRIHRLTLEAVGPFPGRHEIDVDQLSAGGLFLLEGPTGAGKSTIIDAVVFALYGGVAGGESSDDRLHSDHADPATEPFVELTFSTAAGVFRVWRSPKFLRPKRRGGGFTTQNARAKLWRLSGPDDDRGEPLSAQVQEVATELGRIVVLDRAQFTQTVVLPQGQFADFLRARPEDRRDVLQDVFGTELYDRLQRRLAEAARTARGDLERAGTEITAAAEAFIRTLSDAAADEDADGGEGSAGDGAGPRPADRGAVGGARPVSATEAPGHDDPVPWPAALRQAARTFDVPSATELGEELCGAADARAAAADDARERSAEAERTAREHLQGQRDLSARLQRREALTRERTALTARQPQVDLQLERLALARTAARVVPALDVHERAAERLRRAGTAAAKAQDQVRAGADADLALLDEAGLRREHDAATTTLVTLAELVAVEEALPARSADLEKDEAGHTVLQATLTAAEQAAAARPGRRTRIEEELAGHRDAGMRHERARAVLAAAEEVLAAAGEADRMSRAAHAARDAVTAAATAAGRAVEQEAAVRLARVAGIAGELAGALRTGEPCAVCGATEHPAPARPADDHPAPEAVEAATEARERTEQALMDARAALATVEERLAGLRARTGGLDVVAATRGREAAHRDLAQARAAIERHAELEQTLADHDRESTRLTTEISAMRTRLAAAGERLAGRRQTLSGDRTRCEEARGAAASVTARRDQLTARRRAADTLLDCARELAAARRTEQETAHDLAGALETAGLPDADAVRRGTLPRPEEETLAAAVENHAHNLARVTQALAEPALAALTGTETVDVAGADAAHTATMGALTVAAGRASEAALHARQVRAAATTLLDSLRRHEQRARTASPLLRAAALANAGEGNEAGTTLATYVLLRRFEDVVAAANDRLTTMSDGRYALERIDEREGGQRSRKAGLGLQVRDHLTGTPRDPHTLSGGETFYVSLCLALGLADVVRSEAGGVELGTLFIDEGFGSLDPSTLDTVMGELGRLREGGRCVGIVSHVGELKDRIPERIEVRRGPTGASTLRVRC